jgi:hypothetical protein
MCAARLRDLHQSTRRLTHVGKLTDLRVILPDALVQLAKLIKQIR